MYIKIGHASTNYSVFFYVYIFVNACDIFSIYIFLIFISIYIFINYF